MSNVPSSGLHSLATLIKRLEAAASRFEDLTVVLEEEKHKNSGQPASDNRASSSYTQQAQAGAPSAPPPPPPPPAAPPAPATPLSVTDFQTKVLDAKLKPFVELTKGFAGPNVVATVALVEKQFEILFDFLKLVAECQKPDDRVLEKVLGPFPQSIEKVSRAKEDPGRRDKDWSPHLVVLAEGAPVIGWVVQPKPPSHVNDIKDTVVYYGNKIKNEFKEKGPKHAEWVNQYVAILDAMRDYTKAHHADGLSWNPKGVTVDKYKPAASGSGAPPPPPPPPPPAAIPPPAAPAGGAAAVFAELNRGEEVTKGLRKVDRSQMTHKNPALRASSVVPASTSPAAGKKPVKPSKPQALAGKKPPKFALEGNKWMIEHYEAETLTLEEVEISQSVNIFNCKGTTIVIKGKVNAVNILNSAKTAVLVQSVVASISVTNSPSFQVQVTGTAPMIQVDTTDSGQIYLSKQSLNAEITTAKCSAINISLPVEGEEDGVFEEQPVPEMLKTVVVNGKLVTTVVEHSG
ncbi:hypothetical protein D9613_003238 [Agrocybe pediades]|uniref:Adenylyl cyclase-associated protein n=1 Tax=Agrocybe pediades TaxID=84607 RepID=A0A8H4VLV6_9AGAR|nr:hypothetical protein D9613_003238 [Agrocybe pediades]